MPVTVTVTMPSIPLNGAKLTESRRKRHKWPTFAYRNDDGPLQNADRTSAAGTRLRRPADRGCHRSCGPESDACGRTRGLRSLPARHRIEVRGWGHLTFCPDCEPTPKNDHPVRSVSGSVDRTICHEGRPTTPHFLLPAAARSLARSRRVERIGNVLFFARWCDLLHSLGSRASVGLSRALTPHRGEHRDR